MLLRKIAGAAVMTALAAGALAGTTFAAVPKVQESRFAALRHAPSSSVPAAVKRFLDNPRISQGLGIDISQTRRLTAPDGGSWDVIPGAAGICLFVESEQTGGCATTADALAGRLTMQFVEPGPDRPRPGEPFNIPTNTPRFQVGILPDDALSMTATSASHTGLLARPGDDGLYRLASSSGEIGAVTMHRAGKGKLKITAARQHFNGPAKAHSAACTVGINCSYGPIPVSGRNYWENYAFYSGQWGTWSAVREVTVASRDGNTICGNAYNPDNTWAGNFFCINTTAYAYAHQYVGTMRIAWAGPGGASASVLGMAHWAY